MSQLDLSQPVYLNYNSKKFWEISLLNGNRSQIRYGKLVSGVEVDDSIQTVIKQHKDTDSCLAYITRVTETKRIKGYQGNILFQSKQQQQVAPANQPNVVNSQNNGYSINVSAPVDNSNNNKNKQMNDDDEDEDEEQKAVDPNTQCYLQLNNNWNSKFIILTVNKFQVTEITGQLGIKKSYQQSTLLMTNLSSVAQYFEQKIEDSEASGYKREDSKYHYYLKETTEYLQKNDNSNNNGNSGLVVPGRNNNNKNNNKNSSRKMSFDSHSNFSNDSKKSDQTDLSQVSQLDLSFDGDNSISFDQASQNSNNNNNNGVIPNNALGGRGQMEGGVLLAHQAPDDFDPKGWYGSEKMDGVRAIWTGSTFYSRNGNEFYPPPFFIKNFPKCTLDGELFTKREDFQRCVGIVKTHNSKGEKEKDDRWKEITYLVYDAPKLMKPFKDRIKALQEYIPKVNSPYIKVLPHILIQDKDHLEEQLQNTLKKGGEGVMLRDPNSIYEQRRSKTLLKVKCFTDEEATVIGTERGEGRCAGMMGALVCKMKNGIQFKIGSGFNDQQRQRPPKIGSIITFKYQNLTKDNKPRFPIFLRIKEDE